MNIPLIVLSTVLLTNQPSAVIDQQGGSAVVASYTEIHRKTDVGFKHKGQAIFLYSVTNFVSRGPIVTNLIPVIILPKPITNVVRAAPKPQSQPETNAVPPTIPSEDVK